MDFSHLGAAANVLLGLFGGVLGTVLWESVLRPRRERKNVARAIAVETSQNLQLIFGQAHARFRNPTSIPRDFHLSRQAFDAVAERVVELPPDALRNVVRLYGLVNYLNDLVVVYASMLTELRDAPDDASYRPQLQREVDSAIEAFNTNLDVAFDTANQTLRSVHKAAENRWFGEKFIESDGKDLKERLNARLDQRERELGGPRG